MLFKNNFRKGVDNSNTKTCTLSEENIRENIKKLMEWDEEGRQRIDKANCKQQVSMIKFSQWLHKQNDVPDIIKIHSEYLILGVPVSPEMAKQFEPYMERYNQFKASHKKR